MKNVPNLGCILLKPLVPTNASFKKSTKQDIAQEKHNKEEDFLQHGKDIRLVKRFICCSDPPPIRVKCASACCDGEVVQMQDGEKVQIHMRARAHTI